MNLKGLFIDIDDTLLRFKKHAVYAGDTGSLMNVLIDAGVDLGGLERDESEARVNWVKENVLWWSWDDFIAKLELEPKAFWKYAYEKEHRYLEPTENALPQALKSLQEAGLKLFITSNNPNSGIRHKLRLAGFSDNDIDRLFTDILGATEMQNMKWEPEYWRKAVQASGISLNELAVVGDSLHDDFEIPYSTGIPFTFLIDPDKIQLESKNLQPVSGLNEIASIIQQRNK
jgi:FMN phosphatase YigB (HAD superfamily)